MIQLFNCLILFASFKANADYNLRKEEDYQRLVDRLSTLLSEGYQVEDVLKQVDFYSKPPIVKVGYIHAMLSTGKVKFHYKNECLANHRYYYESQYRKELFRYDSRKVKYRAKVPPRGGDKISNG